MAQQTKQAEKELSIREIYSLCRMYQARKQLGRDFTDEEVNNLATQIDEEYKSYALASGRPEEDASDKKPVAGYA